MNPSWGPGDHLNCNQMYTLGRSKEKQYKRITQLLFCPIQSLSSHINHHSAKPELLTPVNFSSALRLHFYFWEAEQFLVHGSYCTSSLNKTIWIHFSLLPFYLGWKAAYRQDFAKAVLEGILINCFVYNLEFSIGSYFKGISMTVPQRGRKNNPLKPTSIKNVKEQR